jgi:tetratricopeptide (TPR) repeat protein
MGARCKRLVAASAVGLLALAASGRPAGADAVDALGKKLVEAEAEVRAIASGVRKPDGVLGQLSNNVAARRLVDAQVNFGVGNFDDAAIVLYDLVEKYPRFQAHDEAVYYLAEALFMKGDYVAARGYFTKLVKEIGPRSKFYVQGLERLIEITLKLSDSTGIEEWMRLLESVPEAERKSSVPYVLGKYYFFNGDYDQAIAFFDRVAKGGKYYLQARYFAGTAAIAAKDLARAVTIFEALVRERPKGNEDRRVIELSQLALGRIHYERDQPSKAVERYLKVSRKSDLFDDALYEVAWVYVKNREFDKSLRALELLAVSDPTSAKLPDVRILEGNLRIRKARTANEAGHGVAQEDYDKADTAFSEVKSTFAGPRNDLDKLIADKVEPRDYMAQITGRESDTFDVEATMPEVAAAWLREEPEVKRIVMVETDLGQIDADIKWADRTMLRIDRAIETPSKVNIFPDLADKRTRSIEVLDDLFNLRIQLASHERNLVAGYASPQERAELDRLQNNRQAIARRLAALPDAEKRERARISQARGAYTSADQRAAEVATMIQSIEAQLVAMEKYLEDTEANQIKPEDLAELKGEIKSSRAEVEAMKKELATVRDELILGQDQAGTGDEVSSRRTDLRAGLRAALDAEHRYMAGLRGKMGGGDRRKAEQIAQLTAKANQVTGQLDNLNRTIDAIVDEALREVRSALDEERGKLLAYRQEFLTYEGDSRGLGGEVLTLAFHAVSKRFYEILIRADVGLVDVGWAMKEATDQTTRRLQLDQARERRTLDTDFADTLKEAREAAERSAPPPTSSTTEDAAARDAGKEPAKGATPPGGTP